MTQEERRAKAEQREIDQLVAQAARARIFKLNPMAAAVRMALAAWPKHYPVAR